ncbi:MAG: LytR C-terminal domain-containing protein [Eubacterium sp.]|nr:LytR C-terminal domain-containing protein [Eubacterium sp.]
MKKPGMIKTILSLLLKVIVVALLMAAIGLGSFQGMTKYITGEFYDFKKASRESEEEQPTKEEPTEVKVDEKSVENTLLFVDSEDGMREYIILSMINKDTSAMNILFIPENAQTQVSRKIQKTLSKRMDGISGTVEFRDIERAYTGEDRYEILSDIIAEMMNIKVDGWDHMTAEGMISFLDTVDYVSIHLNDPISYRDSEGILHMIDEGDAQLGAKEAYAYVTHLDGTSSQESNRLERLNEYAEKFLTRLRAKKKVSAIVKAYQKVVESSKGRSMDVFKKALKAAKNSDYLTLRILQGSETGNVFVIDSMKAQIQVATLSAQAASYSALGNDSDDDSDEDSFDEDRGDSKDLSIEIYNAAYVQGIASEWQYYLEDEGYNITLVDTYQDEGPISTTRIILKRDGIGDDLLRYFSGAEVSVGDIETGGDIRIYVGTDHTRVGTSD